MRTTLFAVMVLTGVLLANACCAQSQQQHDWCYSPTATDDQTIEGCAAMIESGRYTGVELSGLYNNRSTGYDDKGEQGLAARDLEQAVRLDPTNAEAFFNLGSIYFHAHKYNLALSELSQAITLKPGYANAFNYRGLVDETMGDRAGADRDFDEAIQNFDTMTAATPGDALPYYKRCWARAIWGRQLDLALADCGKALEINANYADALSARGVVHFRAGRFAEAIKDSDAAVAIDPTSPAYVYVRGLAKRSNRDPTGAAADIAVAKAINPKIGEEFADYGLSQPR
ncbi:MAG TPA: tetratricopeptide repeat protein [Caulobacteraceae bacterium]|jgi:tetratricopeptide (TPR) repeat protein|nr:tetratricopeptide repeat protein [Caulobacteraceae bacterium]